MFTDKHIPKDRLIMIILLSLCIFFSIIFLSSMYFNSRFDELNRQIEEYEQQYLKLQELSESTEDLDSSIELFQKAINEIDQTYYPDTELTPVQFSKIIKGLLLKYGISIKRYNTDLLTKTSEFIIECSSSQFYSFLSETTLKYSYVNFISVNIENKKNNRFKVFLRVSYANKNSENLSDN